MTSEPSYDQVSFLNTLVPTQDLLNALRLVANSDKLAAFNILYGTALAPTGTLTGAQLQVLFGLGGAPGFNQSSYLSALSKTGAFYQTLQLPSSATARADFNLIYGTPIPPSGPPSGATLGNIFDLAGGPNFNEATYIPALRKTASLYARLRGDSAKRASFNRTYLTALQATGSPTSADRGKIFDITGDPNYNENFFWSRL